jgi:transcriptional regulator with PAS, ATPase and Fis domain
MPGAGPDAVAEAPSPRLTDLTDDGEVRRLAAAALVDLFDSLYEGAVTIDRGGRITWMNDKYKALLGWNGVEPIEGRAIEEVLPNSRLRAVAETGQAELLDVFVVGSRQMVVSRIPLRDGAGVLIGALGVILYDRLQALKPIVSKFQQMQSELATARQQLAEARRPKYLLDDFVGDSTPARGVRDEARRAARRDGAVLLLGETGTGKELIAHAIHAASQRAAGPLVSLNAAAIPEALLEAELFGVEPGAYTGAANKARPGKFQLADGGTLFLDEVGDMPLALQPKLLRVLQEGEVEPIGGTRLKPVDVRVIAATSRDLKAMVEAGRFRADLYYRLNVLPLCLPPLRERLEDLPALCACLLGKLTAEGGSSAAGVGGEVLRRLAGHRWPGNVRELQNVLEQAVARADGQRLDMRHFSGIGGDGALKVDAGGTTRSLREAVAAAEREEIQRALATTGGVKLQAAKLLGISRAQLYEKLAAYGLMSGEPDS